MNRETPPARWSPPSPAAAVVPGAFLVFAGLWMVTGGGPQGLGWAGFAGGLALLLVGAIAAGVEWGLALHDESAE